jgi:cytochrome c556
MTTRTTILAFLFGLTATAGTVQAADVDGMIKYRQNVMKALGGHVGAADRILRGQAPFPDQLKLHAAAAADIAGTIPTLFPADTVPPEAEFAGATVETEATEAITAKPAAFKKAASQTEQATAAFLKAVNDGADAPALARAFKGIGKSCKGCHTDFRKD